MRQYVRERLSLVTAVLSIVSLALVFAAARQAIPPAVLPGLPEWLLGIIPHVNAVVSVLAIGAIVAGVRFVRRGHIRRHRAAMLSAFALFVVFLVLYLGKVAVAGPRSFPASAPNWVELYVYYPVLGIHMLLAIVCLPLLYYVLLLAATHRPAELPETRHPTIGRVAAALWIVSFVLGLVVYVLLYHTFPA